ncbi:hypothetical protein AAMO2058_001536800 [Amorphochlora amoebiformis]
MSSACTSSSRTDPKKAKEGSNLPEVKVDGSFMEGGGQILRNSIAYAVLLGFAMEIDSIRAGRSKPGLRAQHLAGIQLVTDISQGMLVGGEVQSTSIKFTPSEKKGPCKPTYTADTKTAGSICLLIQTALPVTLFQRIPTELVLKGGTNAANAPLIEFSKDALLPFLRKHAGIKAETRLVRRGLFPKGGGEVRLVTTPAKDGIKPIVLTERGRLESITGCATVVGRLPLKMAEEMVEGAVKYIKFYQSSSSESKDIKINITAKREEHPHSSGSFIMLYAKTTEGCVLAASALGQKGTKAASTGRRAAEQMIREWKVCDAEV